MGEQANIDGGWYRNPTDAVTTEYNAERGKAAQAAAAARAKAADEMSAAHTSGVFAEILAQVRENGRQLSDIGLRVKRLEERNENKDRWTGLHASGR